MSFKLVYDRETGKPKGYGFCEYKDQETALSAMRNLNGYEIAGRTLRVDNACTEKSRMEIQSLMAEPVTERSVWMFCNFHPKTNLSFVSVHSVRPVTRPELPRPSARPWPASRQSRCSS